MKRLPSALTMIEPGRLRSARQNHGPFGRGMEGPHQASSSRAVCGPGGDAREQALAGVELRRGGPVDGGRLWLVLLAELEVAFEPSAAEHHAAASPDRVFGALMLHADADDAAVLDEQPGQVAPVDDRDLRVSEPLAEPDRDRVAHREHLLAAQEREEPQEHGPQDGERSAEGAHPEADLAVVRLGDDQVGRRLRVLRVQPGELVAQETCVERDGLDAAALEAATGSLRVVVGVVAHPGEAQRRLRLDEVHHLGPAVDERVAVELGRGVADDRVEVLLRERRVIALAGLHQGVVARDPDAAAAAGSRCRRSSRSSRAARCPGRRVWRPVPRSFRPHRRRRR